MSAVRLRVAVAHPKYAKQEHARTSVKGMLRNCHSLDDECFAKTSETSRPCSPIKSVITVEHPAASSKTVWLDA